MSIPDIQGRLARHRYQQRKAEITSPSGETGSGEKENDGIGAGARYEHGDLKRYRDNPDGQDCHETVFLELLVEFLVRSLTAKEPDQRVAPLIHREHTEVVTQCGCGQVPCQRDRRDSPFTVRVAKHPRDEDDLDRDGDQQGFHHGG